MEPEARASVGGDAAITRVASADGTEIAYRSSGDGPPLLLVLGTGGVHERFAPLLPHLEPHAAVHVMDRRGRGASADAPGYDLAREFEDVAAVVDAIAEASGSSVDVVTGADTPDEIRDDPETVAVALPDARLVVLDGQEHLADILAPELFARQVLAFLRDAATRRPS